LRPSAEDQQGGRPPPLDGAPLPLAGADGVVAGPLPLGGPELGAVLVQVGFGGT
jgi:hypothetical protein